jgi:putative ABC transport system substrate-binding protein
MPAAATDVCLLRDSGLNADVALEPLLTPTGHPAGRNPAAQQSPEVCYPFGHKHWRYCAVKRREFITLLGGAAAWPLAASAQQGGRIYRIGFLTGSFAGNLSNVTAIAYPEFRAELRKRGFIDGRNLVVEIRSTLQERSKLFADVAELVSSNVDLIVASGPEVAVQAALAASPTVPIVMWANNFDPIARGYVQSLARPGGSVTGVFTRQSELAAKQVEILKETFPDRTRLTVLWDALSSDQFAGAERAAKSMQLVVHPIKLENPPYDIAAVFRRVAESQPQMLLVQSSPLFGPHNKEIAEATLQARLPAMFILKSYVDDGGLMSYGVDVRSNFRRLAEYVAKILNGAKPADLPVEQPSKFELALNVKTAKAIGLELPTSLLLRADEVIE